MNNAAVYITSRVERIAGALEQYLPKITCSPSRLHTAMRYAVLNGGKRLRPLLVFATGESFGVPLENLIHAACAVEFIHTYSLVHDDLPAMDNDDLRRGQATCHKAFDEATAILAGDALQVLAFEIILQAENLRCLPERQLEILAVLTRACGSYGMVGGQALEFELLKQKISISDIEKIHQLKTGALIKACVQLGALIANVSPEQKLLLEQYADCLGFAFQIQDDLQDVLTDKTPFSYVAAVGAAAAKSRLKELYHQAITVLQTLGEMAAPLQWLAEYIINEEFRASLEGNCSRRRPIRAYEAGCAR